MVPTLRPVPVGVGVHEVLLDLLEVLVRVPQAAHLVRVGARARVSVRLSVRVKVRVRPRPRARVRVPQG